VKHGNYKNQIPILNHLMNNNFYPLNQRRNKKTTISKNPASKMKMRQKNQEEFCHV